MDKEGLDCLKHDLQNPSKSVPQQPPSSSSLGKAKGPPSRAADNYFRATPSPSSHSRSQHGPSGGYANVPTPDSALRCTDPHIVDIPDTRKYFELCVNIGNYAIEHHEIDISDVTSDSELFRRIWDKYNLSRWKRIWRRIFFQPRTIHFVMVGCPPIRPVPCAHDLSVSRY